MSVFIAEFQNTTAIDISDLEEGIYFLELITESNDRITGRIVKGNWYVTKYQSAIE